jgi:hypothetical protein
MKKMKLKNLRTTEKNNSEDQIASSPLPPSPRREGGNLKHI